MARRYNLFFRPFKERSPRMWSKHSFRISGGAAEESEQAKTRPKFANTETQLQINEFIAWNWPQHKSLPEEIVHAFLRKKSTIKSSVWFLYITSDMQQKFVRPSSLEYKAKKAKKRDKTRVRNRSTNPHVEKSFYINSKFTKT